MPSRPTRAFNCGTASAEHRGLAATAFVPDPAVHAIAPSDMCGWDSPILLAWDAGLPTAGDEWFLNGPAYSLV